MIYIKFLAVIALIGSIAWVVSYPGFESGLAVVGASAALISAFFVQKSKARQPKQHQSVSKSAIGIQAGGDVSVGDISGGNRAK